MAWTEERTALARRLWQEGHSASLIADRVGDGVTKNSVIGKAHRGQWGQRRPAYARPGTPKGWMRPPEPQPEPKAKPRRRARVTPDETTARSHAPRAAPPSPPPPPPPPVLLPPIEALVEPVGRHLTLLDLELGQCRWPLNDPPRGQPYLFCGEPLWPEARSYCGYHFRIGSSGSGGRQFRPGDWR